jgi:AraC-like DNA-binding protein
VEVERPRTPLHAWEEALSRNIGRVDPALREQESVHCFPTDQRPFMARMEFGVLGDVLVAKVACTNYRFTRSLTTPRPTLPTPAMLIAVSSGSCEFFQRGRTCALTPGDWTVIDTKQTHEYRITSREIDAFAIMLPPPSDAAIAALFASGIARRWNGRTGLSRVLNAMINESFGEMRRLPRFSGRRDEASSRVKAYIETQLTDPELSIERIAHACQISVRGLHRLFSDDPAGSVSNYLWRRRLVRCAHALRDPGQAHRSITDICFSYGFSSTSHFSRLFKDRFGVPPVRYRVGLQEGNE